MVDVLAAGSVDGGVLLLKPDMTKLPSKNFRDHFTGEISIEQPPPISDSLKQIVGFPKFSRNPYDNDKTFYKCVSPTYPIIIQDH